MNYHKMNGIIENMLCPAAAVICCSEMTQEEIILNIIGTETLPPPQSIAENINAYPWDIETKYYTASINLIALKDKNLVSCDFAESMNAVVIHFDSEKIESFNAVQSWLPFLEQFNPQVQILACDNCSSEQSSGLKRQEIIEWCLQKQFELVELNPDEVENDEIEDDFQETKGYKRIIQALQAHSWSNLIMKDPPTFQPSQDLLESIRNDGLATASNVGEDVVGISTQAEKDVVDVNEKTDSTKTRIDTLFDEDKWLFDAVGNEDPGGESFEELFSKILSMKEKAENLSGNERKLYAEKVTKEFWRALGGDEDEIAGLSSDEN